MSQRKWKFLGLGLGLGLAMGVLSSCASSPPQPPCASDRLNQIDCPPVSAVADPSVSEAQESRRWHKPNELGFDPIVLGMENTIPVLNARMRMIGSSYEESLRSLAAKIWLIDHAQYTVDAAYYIFKRDLVGYAFLGALCDAVKRGVDVRLMVDSLGSIKVLHTELKAMKNCEAEAGFLRNEQGEVTTTRARAQVVIFNAISNVFVNVNRRSHDKLLVIDGAYPDKAWAMTGGRNISLAYYGLHADGTIDPTAYKDMEILLRPDTTVEQEGSIGLLSEYYFSILFSHNRNKRVTAWLAYDGERKKFKKNLATLRAMPDFDEAYDDMPVYLSQLHSGKALLAHELGNLDNKKVVQAYDENLKRNPNSIVGILGEIGDAGLGSNLVRIVSPYYFVPRYERKDGTVYYDDRDEIQKWLAEDPDHRIEIVTNSVITSDNFFAQAIIDMDTAPHLLLDDYTARRWRLEDLEASEQNPELVASAAWAKMINNPQIKIYQTGRTDSVLLGGDVHYGKLHAKFLVGSGDLSFVGTSNFDYRSRLYNNEMGFFVQSAELVADLNAEFELLKSQSYLWGSPEWLELRRRVMETGETKGKWTAAQRTTFKRLYYSGLHWQF
ncbi:MAG: phospholipase [Proteobacteria bacterium]|nr:phospholipase [Pseudomonadota bacterium]